MFEVGLAELAMIALVALLVLGPERLPRAARMVGLYVRKARAAWHSIRTDIERELAAEDMKQAAARMEHELGSSELRQVVEETSASLTAITAPLDGDSASPASGESTTDTATGATGSGTADRSGA